MPRINPSVCGMGVNVPASMLPRSSSTPVIMGQYQSVEGVGGIMDYLAGRPPEDRTAKLVLHIYKKHFGDSGVPNEWEEQDIYNRLAFFRKNDQRNFGHIRQARIIQEGLRPISIAPQINNTRVDPVGIAPIIILGLGALGITGGLGYLAGRSGNSQPSTLTGEIGKQLGSGMKWAALGFLTYSIYTGKNPIKDFFKK